MTAAQKPFFKIKEGVEYSTDFNFFMREQIFIHRDLSKYKFCSRLESKVFAIKNATSSHVIEDEFKQTKNHTFSEKHINEFCKEIHEEILAGKHGEGVFVD